MFVNYRPDILSTARSEMDSILSENRENLNKLLNIKDKTYISFIRPMMDMDMRIAEFFTPVSHINFVNNTEETQEVYNYCLPEITRYATEIGQNRDVYEAVLSVYEKEKNTLDKTQLKTLDNMLKGFRLSGVHLDDDKKARLMDINMELNKLSTDYAQNVMKDTDAFEIIIEDPKDVEGIPEPDLKAAKCDKGWRFTLKMPSYIAYMTYGVNRDIREQLYKAYCTRAPQNADLIEQTLKLRKEKAQILGFKRYADLSLERKNADSPETVLSFLTDLTGKARKQAESEVEKLKKASGLKDIQSHDTTFYSEKLRRTECGYDEQAYRPYFEQETVVRGLFDFIFSLFAVGFSRADVPVWHESVKAYDLFKNGEIFARIYLDLEFRNGKRDGAWMNDWQTRHIDAMGRVRPATALICANFPQSTPENPSLLRHSDVVTLFHEMGHALHHLLSDVNEADVSGVNGVEWDVIEFPSQFLELFAYSREVLRMFARHHETGEVLTEEMIDKLDCVRTFMSASAMMRQLEFGTFDILIHEEAYSAEDVQKILDGVRQKTSIIVPPSYNRFQNSFSHIFAGGYGAGYYSYKWAERLSCDAYSIFEKHGVFHRETGESFLNNVLSKGGSGDMIEFFRTFAGREPDNTALLTVNGIK
ncbi:MAG: M3 family metallopeptidase [Deferribacterales bacterium]